MITITEIILAVLAIVAAVMWTAIGWQWGLLIFGIILILLFVSGKQIPANPPHVAKPTLWGRRLPQMYIKERIAFVFSYFPIIEDLILINRTQKDQNFEIKEVRCKADTSDAGKKQSGGSVTVRGQIVWEPDWRYPQRLDTYIDVGLEDQVRKILDGIVGETARQVGAEKDWETLMLEKELLSLEIISRIVGSQPTARVKTTADGKPERNTRPEVGKYEIEGEIPAGQEPNRWEIEQFLDTILINGPSDVRGLGIRLRRCNVTAVEPEGELKKDAELRAREGVQRTAEEYDFDTEIRLAKKYLDEAKARSETMTLEQALEKVRINRRRDNVREVVVRSSGSPLTDAAALIAGQGGRP